jgi:hypothetical protein
MCKRWEGIARARHRSHHYGACPNAGRIAGDGVSRPRRQPRISQETRDRVQEAARIAGYVPNRAARALVTGKGSGFVGLVLSDPGYGREHSYLGEFVQGLGQGFSEHGIDLFLAFVPDGQSEMQVIRNIVSSRRADGLVLGRTTEADPRIAYLVDQRFPFVPTAGRTSTPRPSTGSTLTARQRSKGFRLLHDLGHRRFGLVSIEEPMTFRQHRVEGLRTAMQGTGATLTIAASPRYDTARARRGDPGDAGRPGPAHGRDVPVRRPRAFGARCRGKPRALRAARPLRPRLRQHRAGGPCPARAHHVRQRHAGFGPRARRRCS